jgi:hypothetical protein
VPLPRAFQGRHHFFPARIADELVTDFVIFFWIGETFSAADAFRGTFFQVKINPILE